MYILHPIARWERDSVRDSVKHDASADEDLVQGGGVEFGGVGAGVEVKFAGAVGKVFQKASHGCGGHASGIAQAENVVRETNAVGGEFRSSGLAEVSEDPREQRGWAGFADEPGFAKAEFGGNRQGEAQDGGMEVEVEVAVPIGGRETAGAEVLELRADGGSEGAVGPVVEEIAETSPRRRFGANREMQADAESRVAAGDHEGLGDVRFVDHEACLGDEPGAVQAFDGGVDRGAPAEIVGGEDEGFQSAAGRRRKGA